MTRPTNHRATVRRTRHATTTTVQHALAQDDLLPPRTWVRASLELFHRILLLTPDAQRVLTVLLSQMTMDCDKVHLSQKQIVELANELADSADNDDPLVDLLNLTPIRVSRAAALLKKSGIAVFAKKGGFWTIEPTLVQFGNVLNDPTLAAMFTDYDDGVPFPTDDARNNGNEPLRAEGINADASSGDVKSRDIMGKEASR